MAIITISRGSLSGGGQLADSLGSKLGYRVISREVIVEASKNFDVPESELSEELKSPPKIWKRLSRHKERYLAAAQATLAEMVEGGDAIYHGHAGHVLLQGVPQVLKVRLIAPLEYRIKAALIEHGLSREQAIKHIESVDEQRDKWVRHFYGVEWSDPALYDLVFNLEHISIEDATEMVADLVGRDAFRSSTETKRQLRDFALQSRLRALFTFHTDFPDNAAEVSVRNGVVQLSGGAYFDKHRKEIIAFAKGVPGVSEVLPGDEVKVASQARPTGDTTARELMIPLNRYPHIHSWNTVREGMVALSASTVVLDDGHLIYPRYLLVLDKEERLEGIISRRDLLKGLTPQLRSLERAREQTGDMAPYADMLFPMDFQWSSLFDRAAVDNSREPVATITSPIRGTVKHDEDLSHVVSRMIEQGIDLIPVLDGERVIGVVLMTDVFDTVAQFVLEEGGAPR